MRAQEAHEKHQAGDDKQRTGGDQVHRLAEPDEREDAERHDKGDVISAREIIEVGDQRDAWANEGCNADAPMLVGRSLAQPPLAQFL